MTENQEPYEIKVKDHRISETKDVAVQEGPYAAVMMAMQKGYTPELIEKMMALQERFEATEARKAFYQAVADFKSEAPPVNKDKFNKWFESWYTSLGNLLDTYNPVIGKHGLSISFPTPQQTDKTMTVECRLSHRMGHSEGVSITAPIDSAAIGKISGQKSRNAIQDIKSTFTYLRSATCEAVLGVSGTDASAADDDGNGYGRGEYLTEDQQIEISDKIKVLYPKTPEKFLKWFGCESVEKIPAKEYGRAIGALKNIALGAKSKKAERTPGEEG